MKMERKRIIHAERSPGEAACGQSRVETTPIRTQVTCGACLLLAAPEVETWPVGEEREVERGAYALTPREAKLVSQSVAGDDGGGEEYRWRSLGAAMRQYARVIDDGTPIRSSFRAESPVQGSSGTSRAGGRDEIVLVEVGIEKAFTTDRVFRGTVVTARQQRAVFEALEFGRVEITRIAPGRKGTKKERVGVTATEVAEVYFGGALTAHEVGMIVRDGRRRVRAHLESRGALPERQTSEARAKTHAEGDEMAKVPGYDLEGLKDIANHLDLSETTVKRLMARQTRPLPVVKYLSFILAKKSEVDTWRADEIARPVYERGGGAEDASQMRLGLADD